MEPGPSRKQKKAATRLQLLEAARASFIEESFDSATIASITTRCGVAHGTFYVHFPSKESVLAELVAEFNRGLASSMEPLWREASELDLRGLVERAAAIFLSYWSDRREDVEMCARGLVGALGVEELRDGVNPVMVELLSTWLRSLRATEADRVEVDLATQALLSMWLRVGMQFLFNPAVSRTAAERTLIEMSLGALRALLNVEDRS